MTVEQEFKIRNVQGSDGTKKIDIPKHIAEKLDIDVGDKVKIELIGRKIIIEPIKEKQKIRDLDIEKQDDRIIIEVKDKGGQKHKLQFKNKITIHTGKQKATLQTIYTHLDSIRGYYKIEQGEEYELTLWNKGKLQYTIEDFSHRRNKKSNINPKERADKILWQKQN